MSLQQLPAMITEFKELATAYLRQETVERAAELRRLGGFSLGAALAWGFAIILLAVAGMRALVDALPDSPYWEALGYLLAVLALVALATVLYQLGPKPSEEGG
ncbi:MAG: hypothetical protein BMS9Abin07_0217 [Acidimicrobiia bacterium]|nr:MAG: hypothetical protein BMS9Abin07_0217 [Acidimicrobiia bacterium]